MNYLVYPFPTIRKVLRVTLASLNRELDHLDDATLAERLARPAAASRMSYGRHRGQDAVIEQSWWRSWPAGTA